MPTMLPITLPPLKDSGAREAFATGSVRDTRVGKGRFDLLPPRAMREVAQHFEAGAAKYGDRNWEKGQPLSRYLDSALRHTMLVLQGETDENHAAAAAWNLLCFVDTRARVAAGLLPPELNDLPTTPANGAITPRSASTGPIEGD